MTTDNFCFCFQNRLIQTSQTGGHQYSDTSPFSIPWSTTSESSIMLLEASLSILEASFMSFKVQVSLIIIIYDHNMFKVMWPVL